MIRRDLETLIAQSQPLRRSTRIKWQPDRFGYSLLDPDCIFSLISNIDEPRTIREATVMSDVDSLMEAMNKDMTSLKKNNTWDLVPFPKDISLWDANGC